MPQLGAALSFDGVSLPFSVTDIVTSVFNFMTAFSDYILLGIAIALIPKFVSLIIGFFGRRKAEV
ncbi:hypothetical protein U3A55_02420 [Salarchaeum sp. III]|uniref:hypothetical protein n=1 Tax=Salarchaeum sp. III TaxID=3107927 RepID=UPI002EDA3332